MPNWQNQPHYISCKPQLCKETFIKTYFSGDFFAGQFIPLTCPSMVLISSKSKHTSSQKLSLSGGTFWINYLENASRRSISSISSVRSCKKQELQSHTNKVLRLSLFMEHNLKLVLVLASWVLTFLCSMYLCILTRDLSRDDCIEEFIKRIWSSGLVWTVGLQSGLQWLKNSQMH